MIESDSIELEFRKGLPMVESRDPEALKEEIEHLEAINSRPHFWQRWQGYLKFSGPGLVCPAQRSQWYPTYKYQETRMKKISSYLYTENVSGILRR